MLDTLLFFVVAETNLKRCQGHSFLVYMFDFLWRHAKPVGMGIVAFNAILMALFRSLSVLQKMLLMTRWGAADLILLAERNFCLE